METLTKLIVRVADLAEAEGRVLRAMVMRSAMGIGSLLVAAAAVVAGVTLLLCSVYICTSESAGRAAAAAVTGILALAIGGGFVWLGHRIGS